MTNRLQRASALFLIILFLASVLPTFVSPENVAAASTTLIPSKDTYIRSGAGAGVNYGSATSIKVGVTALAGCGGESERGLVEFIDPWGAWVPHNSTITSAYLEMYYYAYSTNNPVGRGIYAQRILHVGSDFWTESQANWNRYVYGTNWNVAGAAGLGVDYTTAGQSVALVPGSYGWMSWPVTTQAQWAQTNDEDLSFRIYDPSEGDCGCSGEDCYELSFYSYEGAPTLAPRLVINYIPPAAPSVGTIGADNVTYDSASLYGKIIDVGDASATVRGFKYGLGQTDTWDEHETGTFTAEEYSLNLTGLIPDSTYYFRAYATNTYGTSYGSWESFSTSTGIPVVTTDSVYVYEFCTGINAAMSGTITSTGNATVTVRGFQYGLTPYSASGDVHENGIWYTGNYTLTEFLTSNSSYWFRAYATNSEGTGYGPWKPFYSPGTVSDCSGGGGANVTGSGTVGDPYVIWSVYGLQDMQSHLSSYWELGCSINATETVSWNGGAGFVPVGTFTGSLDGNYHSIYGLYVNKTASSTFDVGLFAKLGSSSVVANLIILDADITGSASGANKGCHGGILAGRSGYSTISRVYVSGNVSATGADTGLPGHVLTCAGGLVGYGDTGTQISECAADVDASAYRAASDTYNAAGGLIGFFYHDYSVATSYIEDSYALGDAYAQGGGYSGCGGLVGQYYATQSGSSIDNTYSIGTATGGQTNGGLIGWKGGGAVTDSFWDTQTSGLGSSAAGTGKTTPEMKDQDTFMDAGWDFVSTWGIDELINNGYPYLQWALITPPERGDEYTLILSSTTGGNVTNPGEGAFNYTYGQVVSLTGAPGTGYRFALWVGDVSEVADTHSANTTVTMTNDFTITAVFVETGKRALYLTSTAGGNVTDPGEGLFSYDDDAVVGLNASADGGYAFVQWSGDAGGVLDIYDETTDVTMLDDYAIVANFVSSGNYLLIVDSTDGGEVLYPGEGVFEYAPAAVVDLVAQPNPGCWFEEWAGNVSTVDDVYSATTNITMSNNYSITAEFGGGETFDLTVSSTTGGNVTTPGESTYTYASGTIVSLAAIPDDGYDFFVWGGDVGTVDDLTAAFTTITMNGDYDIVANFEPTEECSLSLSLSASEGGNITAPGEGVYTFPCDTEIQITAQAYDGWWFKEWTGDTEGIANALSFNTTVMMSDDYVITATFVEEESPPAGSPTVVTYNASSLAATSAWLNGGLTSLGNYTQGYVFYNYGLTDSYGMNTPTQLMGATGNFTRWISNLASNTTYHFRAVCQYGSYVYGADVTFNTTESESCCGDCLWEGIHDYEALLTGDDDITQVYGAIWYGQTFTVDPESHSVTDVRFKGYRVGEPSTVTVSIRACGDDGLPTGEDLTSGTMDGDVVTNSTAGDWYGVALTETSLEYGEMYAICFRAEAGDAANYLALRIDTDDGYDGGYGIAPGAESGGVIWVSDTDNDIMFQVDGQALIRIMDARVFTDYLEADDMLIVLSYLNTYVPYYPDQVASLHFWIQFRSAGGDAVLAQTVCQQWGYMPGSIYLNANQAASLTYGAPYRVYLYGLSSEHPIACYNLATTDWLGDALVLLPPWVIATAHAMADYYGVAMTTQLENVEVLNSEGGVLFATGIPSLVLTNPEIFADVTYTPDYNPFTPGPNAFDTATTWQQQVGPVLASLANSAAGLFGLDGKYAIDFLLFIIYLGVCYIVVRYKADPIIGTFLCIPLLLGAAQLRILDFQLIAAIGAVAVLMTVYRFAFSRT